MPGALSLVMMYKYRLNDTTCIIQTIELFKHGNLMLVWQWASHNNYWQYHHDPQ